MNAQEALVNIGYSKAEARKILPSLFLYLFRAFKQSELYRRAELINPNVDLFKLMPRIPLMGEITLHDKVCIFALFQGENPGIKPNAYIKTAVLSDPEVQDWLSQYKDFPAYDIATVRALEGRALANPEITTYIGKFINRKMRFIMDYYGVEFEELCEALQERAIHNLRVNYPNWNSSGEMLAMSKSAIANAGQNLLKYYSATKRAKVDKNNKAVEYSLDAIQELNGSGPEYQALVYSDTLDRGMEIMEASLSVEQLIKSLHSKPKAKLLVELLSGKYNAGFSNFLNRDCCEYADEAPFEKLLSKACDYIGVDVDKAMPFLKKMTHTALRVTTESLVRH
jgi:hypothetical protein